MIATKPLDQPNRLVDQAAQSADHAIKSTQRVANEALDGLADSVQEMRHQAAPLLNRAAEQASALAQRGRDTVRDSSNQLRARAQRASASTVNYIKDEPLKATLIAAATGAALMTVIGLIGRWRGRGGRAAVAGQQ